MVPLLVINTNVMMGIRISGKWWPAISRANTSLGFGQASVADRRTVRDSGGHREDRIVIQTPIKVGEQHILSDITLTSREDMLFRMLLGRRTLVEASAMVDVSLSYALGRYRIKDCVRQYRRKT